MFKRSFTLALSALLLAGCQSGGHDSYRSPKLTAAQDGLAYNSYVPRHLLRVWGDYALSGALERVTIGAGVNAQSSNYRVSPISGNDITQAGYAIWNGRIGYRIDDTWSVALNGNNLFDKRYYATVGTEGFGNFYGEPRNFVMSLKADF